MKKYRLHDLQDINAGHILKDILPGEFIAVGGLAFTEPGERSHTNDGPGGKDYHVHEDCEAFIIIQGKGSLEVDKAFYPVTTGDVIVVEPGEDHHVVSSMEDPIITFWCHGGSHRNKNQI